MRALAYVIGAAALLAGSAAQAQTAESQTVDYEVRIKGDGSPADTAHHPDHHSPSARPPFELEAQQKRPADGAQNRNLWTTRARNAPLWTTVRNPRFRTTLDSGKFHFPHILLRRGTAGNSPETAR